VQVSEAASHMLVLGRPLVTPVATNYVGTLNQGYPLLWYEGAAPIPHL
jgi:hypothetical protein